MTRSPILVLLCVLGLSTACGPGWEGYADNYSEVVDVPDEPWAGDETVFVALDDVTVETPLAGLATYDYEGAPSVRLSELIIQSGVTETPESYRYDFTATDGYDLFIKRYEDLSLLPSWTEMTNGYLYLDPRYDDLTCGWTEHPWGSALSAYQVKWMNGGVITLLAYP
jgi:hypothetical protein